MRRRPAPFFASMRGKSRRREQGTYPRSRPGRNVNGGTSPVHTAFLSVRRDAGAGTLGFLARGKKGSGEGVERAARESGSVGNSSVFSREKLGASVNGTAGCAEMRERRYRRPGFSAQVGRPFTDAPSFPHGGRGGITDAPPFPRSRSPDLPTLPDSRAVLEGHTKKRLVPSRMARGVYLTRARSRAESRGEALTRRPGCCSRGQPWRRRQRRRSSCGRARSTRAPRRAWSRPWR